MVCTLPAVEAVRKSFPDAFLGYVVEDRAEPLIRGHPSLDAVHVFRRWWLVREWKRKNLKGALAEVHRFLEELRHKEYDLVLDFQRNLKGGIISLLSGGKLRVGFSRPIAIEGNWLFSQKKIPVPPHLPWVDRYLALVRALGATGAPEAYRFPESQESRERVERFLREQGLTRFGVIHPTASAFDPKRIWAPERFGAVAERVHRERGLPFLVTFGPGEEAIAEAVVKASGKAARKAFPTRTLLDLVELYRRATLYIGCDTGPMHIASALGVPCLVVYGSGNPHLYGPRSPLSQIVCKKEAGGRIAPLHRLEPEMVWKAALNLLEALEGKKQGMGNPSGNDPLPALSPIPGTRP